MKSRINWLSLGDRNTKFLQTTALNNRRRNKIHHLFINDNTWTMDQLEIENELRNYLIVTYKDNNNLIDTFLNNFQFRNILNLNMINDTPSTLLLTLKSKHP